jgi:DNA-directed RNA polymerase specialized sigma24 family protein
MRKPDKIPWVGNGGREFPETSWTVVLNAAEQREAKEILYELYRRPLCCLLRRKGFPQADADEYTQDFLAQILLGREFIDKINRKKAKKFRSFLVKAFLNHVYDQLRKRREHSLDDSPSCVYELPDPRDAARTFDYEWGVGILQRVMEDVKAQCLQDGLETHWRVFEERVLTPTLNGEEPPSLPDICARRDIRSTDQVSNMIVTVKRRFQKTLVQRLTNVTDSPQGFQDELRDFIEIFSNE